MGTLIGSSFRNAFCTDFNGVDEYMYKDDPSWKGNTAGAWSFWIKIDATFGANGADFVASCGVRDAGNDSTIAFGPRRATSTGASTYMAIVQRSTHGGQVHGYAGTTTPLTAGTWHHIVIQSSGTAWFMYVDGVSQTLTNWFGAGSVNNGNWFGDVSGTDHRLVLGVTYSSNAIGTNYYAGLTDEMLYLPGRVFTAGEVAELYNSGVRRNPYRYSFASALATWWRMGDSRDSATTVFDEIGSNNLTLVNMDASNYVAP